MPHPATRIIALYGAFNEILADLGQESRIIARTQADEQPPSIMDKPVIGTHLRPNPELILGLKPDLIVQLGGRAEALEPVRFLEAHGVPTAVFEMSSFAQLCAATERIGALTGAHDQALARVVSLRAALAALEADRPVRTPSIFFEVRYPQLLAAGQSSMLTEIIHLAGGRNAVTAPDKLVRLSEEEVLRLDPDIYLVQRGPMNPNPIPVFARPHFATLRCRATGHVVEVDQQLFSRPGPRSLDAVRQLAAVVRSWDAAQEAQP